MAWTAPRTWVVGDVVTAAMMNAHVRDNLLYLHDNPPYKPIDSVFSTGAAGWGGEADLVLGTSQAYDGRPVTVEFSIDQCVQNGNVCVFKLYIDSTFLNTIAQTTATTSGPGVPVYGALEHTPSAGTHRYKVTETATAGGSAPVQGVNRLRVRSQAY